MTTPKPASAPPADSVQAIIAEMRDEAMHAKTSDRRDTATRWADRIEALAASAQVREVEPCKTESVRVGFSSQGEPMYANVPAPEPVPVAQGDVISSPRQVADWLDSMTTCDAAMSPGERHNLAVAAKLMRQLCAQAALDAQAVGRAFNTVRATEASLAACRALVPKWRDEASAEVAHGKNKEWAEWVRERHMATASTLNGCARELDDAARGQP